MLQLRLRESIYDPIIEAMRSGYPWGAPKGEFYLLSGNITPKVPRPTLFVLETDRVGAIVQFEIAQLNQASVGVDTRNAPTVFQVEAVAESTTVPIQLSPGINQIQVTILNEPRETAYYIAKASSIVSLWEGWARVLYSEASRIVEDQKRAIYSQLGTRLVEPFLNFPELLPDIQSLQILSTRLATRGMIHETGTNSGVKDLLTAFSLSTPAHRPMERDDFDIDVLDPHTNTSSQVYGQESHVWIPNLGIASWAAFLKYIAGHEDLYTPVKVSEEEVGIIYQGQLEIHTFNFDDFGADFITAIARSQCFKSIEITIMVSSNVAFKICAAAYTFDLFITEENPIGDARKYLDMGVPLDSGLPFDNDPVDPFNEGWVGLSLSGRFEQEGIPEHCLDTFVFPSTTYAGDDCCYPGHFTQIVEHQRYDFDLNAKPFVSGSLS